MALCLTGVAGCSSSGGDTNPTDTSSGGFEPASPNTASDTDTATDADTSQDDENPTPVDDTTGPATTLVGQWSTYGMALYGEVDGTVYSGDITHWYGASIVIQVGADGTYLSYGAATTGQPGTWTATDDGTYQFQSTDSQGNPTTTVMTIKGNLMFGAKAPPTDFGRTGTGYMQWVYNKTS